MAKDKTADQQTREAPSSASFRRRPVPPPFASPADERAWHVEQERAERELAEATRKHPPGSTLYVSTARGIARRGRAGLSFSEKPTAVEVVDLTEAELAKIRALSQAQLEAMRAGEIPDGLEGVDVALAVRVRGGAYLATPLGAKAISEDDGLVVFGAPDRGDTAAELDRRDQEIADLKAQNKRLEAELKSARRGSSAGEGGPERLARGKDGGKTDADFGDDKGKA